MIASSPAIRLSNHAASLIASPRRKTALALLKRAAALEPLPGIQVNLAIAHMTMGQYDEASRLLYSLVQQDPNDLAAWHAYGVLSLVVALPVDAIDCFKRCILLEPSHPPHRFDLSVALMQAGRWEEGWEAYEARKDHKPERVFPGLPRWDGTPGQTVYVWAEQGLGDTFQFCRYLPRLRELSKKVVLAIPPSLHGVLAGYRDVVDIMAFNTEVADIDAEVSLMSLPRLLGPTPDLWPADPGLIGKGIAPMALNNKTLKIGLCWACGGLSHHKEERSVPFQEMLLLAENSHASFYSLQVGDEAAAITASGAQLVVTDLSPATTDDWAMTVAAIKALDIVVSTDTAVAHLAAALGKQTIMLLARRDWWRWGNEGTTTPWYPTMTIVRQELPFKWEKEIQQVSAIIGQAAQDRFTSLAA